MGHLKKLFKGGVDLDSNRLENLASPLQGGDAVNKTYADGLHANPMSFLSEYHTVLYVKPDGDDVFGAKNMPTRPYKTIAEALRSIVQEDGRTLVIADEITEVTTGYSLPQTNEVHFKLIRTTITTTDASVFTNISNNLKLKNSIKIILIKSRVFSKKMGIGNTALFIDGPYNDIHIEGDGDATTEMSSISIRGVCGNVSIRNIICPLLHLDIQAEGDMTLENVYEIFSVPKNIKTAGDILIKGCRFRRTENIDVMLASMGYTGSLMLKSLDGTLWNNAFSVSGLASYFSSASAAMAFAPQGEHLHTYREVFYINQTDPYFSSSSIRIEGNLFSIMQTQTYAIRLGVDTINASDKGHTYIFSDNDFHLASSDHPAVQFLAYSKLANRIYSGGNYGHNNMPPVHAVTSSGNTANVSHSFIGDTLQELPNSFLGHPHTQKTGEVDMGSLLTKRQVLDLLDGTSGVLEYTSRGADVWDEVRLGGYMPYVITVTDTGGNETYSASLALSRQGTDIGLSATSVHERNGVRVEYDVEDSAGRPLLKVKGAPFGAKVRLKSV